MRLLKAVSKLHLILFATRWTTIQTIYLLVYDVFHQTENFGKQTSLPIFFLMLNINSGLEPDTLLPCKADKMEG